MVISPNGISETSDVHHCGGAVWPTEWNPRPSTRTMWSSCRVSRDCYVLNTLHAMSLSSTLLLDVHQRIVHRHCQRRLVWESTDHQRRFSGTLCPRNRCQKVVSPLSSSVPHVVQTEKLICILVLASKHSFDPSQFPSIVSSVS